MLLIQKFNTTEQIKIAAQGKSNQYVRRKLKAPQMKSTAEHNSLKIDIIQLSREGEVNIYSGEYKPRREASSYISSALHRP